MAAISVNVMAQEVKSGAIEVGDFTNASEYYNGSYFEMAPTNFYIAHTGAQLLYTPDVLADLEGKQNVKITGLHFKFFNEGAYSDITRDVKIYLQETDATEFAVVDGKKQFFAFEGPVLEEELYLDMLSYIYEDIETPFEFSGAPFALTPGKGLLVTIVFDAQDDDNCTDGSDYAPFYTSGIGGKAMVYTHNTASFLDFAQGADFPDATAMLGCGVNVDLPVTLIDYTYTEGGAASLRGDADMDGEVNVADVTAVISYLLGNEVERFDAEAANCDLSEDGVSVSDVTVLINYLLNNNW